MIDIHDDEKCRSIRRDLNKQLRLLRGKAPELFVEAFEGLITALDYRDTTMMVAHLRTALNSVHEKAVESVEKVLTFSERGLNLCDEVVGELGNGAIKPSEEFDDLGHDLSDLATAAIGKLDGLIKLIGVISRHVEEPICHAELVRELEKWQEMKARVIDPWPWSAMKIPPVNWDMVARSRAAFERGDGVLLSDVIQQVTAEKN
jgi:hypothetical protein